MRTLPQHITLLTGIGHCTRDTRASGGLRHVSTFSLYVVLLCVASIGVVTLVSSFTVHEGDYPFTTWTSDLVTVSPSTTGQTYYVSTHTGSDANNGLKVNTPFATIGKTLPLIVAGDTVLMMGGIYRESLDVSNSASGTSTKPITFGSYGDGEVIIDGSSQVTGWSSQVSGSTVWTSHALSFIPVAFVLNEVPLHPATTKAGVTSGSGLYYYDTTTKMITADFGSVANPNTADVIVPNDKGDQAHVYFYDQQYIIFKGLTIRGSGSAGVWGYGSHILVERCNIKFNGKAAISFQPYDFGLKGTDNSVLYTHAYHNVLVNWPRGNNGYAIDGGGWPGAVGWSGNLRPLARGNIVHMNGGEGIITYGTQSYAPSGSALFDENVAYDNWSVNMYFDNQPGNIARNNIIYNNPPDPSTWLHPPSQGSPWNELYKYSVCLMLADEENSSDNTGGYANLENTLVSGNYLAGCRVLIRDYSEGNAHSIPNHGMKNLNISGNTMIMPSSASFPSDTDIFGILMQDNVTPSGTNRNYGSVITGNKVYTSSATIPIVWSAYSGAIPSGITLDRNTYCTSSTSLGTPFRVGYDTPSSVTFAQWKTITLQDPTSTFNVCAPPQSSSSTGQGASSSSAVSLSSSTAASSSSSTGKSSSSSSSSVSSSSSATSSTAASSSSGSGIDSSSSPSASSSSSSSSSTAVDSFSSTGSAIGSSSSSGLGGETNVNSASAFSLSTLTLAFFFVSVFFLSM